MIRTFWRNLIWSVVLMIGVQTNTAQPLESMPPALTTDAPLRVWVDQMGYRPSSRKIAIIAADKPQALPNLPLNLFRDALRCDNLGARVELKGSRSIDHDF